MNFMDITSHLESGKVPMDLVHKLHLSHRRTSFRIIPFDARKIIPRAGDSDTIEDWIVNKQD